MATFHKNNINNNNNNVRHQSRIISIPLNEKNTCSIGIGLTGIVADNISLLQEIKSQISSFTKWYGMYSPYNHNNNHNDDNDDSDLYISIENAVNTIGNSIGKECQKCSFGGGIRPYGSSIVICGIDEKNDNVSIVVTYPSGNVVTMKPKSNKQKLSAFVIGGEDRIKNDIYKKISADKKDYEDDMTLTNVLRMIVNALLSSSLSNDNDNDDTIITKEDVIKKSCYDSFEIAVLTKSNGMYRLQDSHIEKIIKSLS